MKLGSGTELNSTAIHIRPNLEKEWPLLKTAALQLSQINKKNLYKAYLQVLNKQKKGKKEKCALGLTNRVIPHLTGGFSTSRH